MSACAGLRSTTSVADLDDGSSIAAGASRQAGLLKQFRQNTIADGSCAFYALTDTPNKAVKGVHVLRTAALKTIDIYWSAKGSSVPFATALRPSETNDNMCLGAILRSSFDDQDRLDLPDLTRAQAAEVAQLSAHVDAADCKFQRQFGNFMRDPGLYVGVTELSAAAWKQHLQVYVFVANTVDALGMPQLANPSQPLGFVGGVTVCVLHTEKNGAPHYERFAIPPADLEYELVRARAIAAFVAGEHSGRSLPACRTCDDSSTTVRLSSGQVVCATCFEEETGFTFEPKTMADRQDNIDVVATANALAHQIEIFQDYPVALQWHAFSGLYTTGRCDECDVADVVIIRTGRAFSFPTGDATYEGDAFAYCRACATQPIELDDDDDDGAFRV